jgi:hypothetical protein
MTSLVQAEEDNGGKWSVVMLEITSIDKARGHILSIDGIPLCKKWNQHRHVSPIPATSNRVIVWGSIHAMEDICRPCKKVFFKMSEAERRTLVLHPPSRMGFGRSIISLS